MNEQKVPLDHFAIAPCSTGAITSGIGTSGFAVIRQTGSGTIDTEIVVQNAQPNTSYNVRVVQTPGGPDCFQFDGTLTTDAQGNGAGHFSEAVISGTTGAFVDLSSIGIAGDFYNTPNVTFR
ncbi:MAG TPA: hypothetical protein VFR68_04565 [Candidatus Dormibacteraeota bacterium]|nr:hypothetical protein [Candidatus Dormibacteraeota bacterium]